MSIAHTQQQQCPTLAQDETVREVPYLPCVRCPDGRCLNLAFVAEWTRSERDNALILTMAYPAIFGTGARVVSLPVGPFADWVEDLLDVVTLDGPDS